MKAIAVFVWFQLMVELLYCGHTITGTTFFITELGSQGITGVNPKDVVLSFYELLWTSNYEKRFSFRLQYLHQEMYIHVFWKYFYHFGKDNRIVFVSNIKRSVSNWGKLVFCEREPTRKTKIRVDASFTTARFTTKLCLWTKLFESLFYCTV